MVIIGLVEVLKGIGDAFIHQKKSQGNGKSPIIEEQYLISLSEKSWKLSNENGLQMKHYAME